MTIQDLMNDRIIGQKDITAVWSKMYNINTWPGVLKNIKSNKFPLRQTPSGKPMFLKSELISIDIKFQEILFPAS